MLRCIMIFFCILWGFSPAVPGILPGENGGVTKLIRLLHTYHRGTTVHSIANKNAHVVS